MSKTFRKIISTIIIITTILAVYLGALSAFRKSSLYINAIKAPYTNEYTTAKQITDNFEKVFNSPSPVGQDELIKRTFATITTIANNEELPEEVLVYLAEFVEDNAVEDELIHLQYIANMYNRLYLNTEKQEYLKKGEEYLIKVREIGPKLPQPLESLAILYTKTGEVDKLQEITNKILELWPDHPSIKKNK
ncbi:MAG: hypothetical protein WD095_01540 [Candidatus Paceibacterota bacterium]